MHSRIPRQGFTYLATSQTAGQSISPSRAAPCVLPARYNVLTNVLSSLRAGFGCCHCYLCRGAGGFVCWCCGLLLVPFQRRVFLLPGEGSWGKAHWLLSQAWEQAASTEMTVWHPASLGCPSSCLAETSTQSVPFTPAAHCSSLSSLSQLSLVMPQSLCYRTNPGEMCLPGHLAVGCGWWRLVVVGVYFHNINELDDPVISIVLVCLNYLWIHGF